jgi:hypothetical protein
MLELSKFLSVPFISGVDMIIKAGRAFTLANVESCRKIFTFIFIPTLDLKR